MVFSGYTLDELRGPSTPIGSVFLLEEIDLLVDGRYQADHPETSAASWLEQPALPLFHVAIHAWCRGDSRGQTAQTVELQISADGRALVSGWPKQTLACEGVSVRSEW